MKAIRITFETVGDEPSYVKSSFVPVEQLLSTDGGMLSVAAEAGAREFWDAVVAMGKLDDT